MHIRVARPPDAQATFSERSPRLSVPYTVMFGWATTTKSCERKKLEKKLMTGGQKDPGKFG